MAKKSRKKIKVGVIGYGGSFNMGKHHLNLMASQGMQPTAVFDIDSSRLDVARENFPDIELYSSLPDMLKKSDVDLITIITPHNTHADLATQCLKAGRHVVVEKPMAITAAECDRMIRAAQKYKRMLSVFHNRHWDGYIVQALKELRNGRLGEVLHMDMCWSRHIHPGEAWRASKIRSGGVFYDWGAHLLECAQRIITDDVQEVTAFTHSGYWAGQCHWKKDTIEDEATAVIRYKKGQWIKLTSSQVDCHAGPWIIQITCTGGSFQGSYGNWQSIQQKKGKTITTRGRNPKARPDLYYRNIARYLAGKEKLIITPEIARRPIQILDLASRSALAGKALKANFK